MPTGNRAAWRETVARRRTFGSVRKLPSGRWQVRYRDRSGEHHTAPVTFRTKAEAHSYLSSIETDLARGQWLDQRRATVLFEDWSADWLASTVNLRPSSRARDESYLRSLILPTFGQIQVGEIDHLMVRAWVGELVDTGRAPATVVKAAQVLGKILTAAVEARLIAMSPVKGVPLPRIDRVEMRFLTPREIDRLAETVDPRYRAAVLVAAYCGLRAGELFGLKVNRVDLQRRQLDIAEIVVEVRGEITVGPPKTRAGRRSVPVPAIVADELTTHVQGRVPEEYVFPAPAGGPVRLGQWRQRFWIPAVERAGLAPLRIHDLRHTAVALWLAAGANPVDVARRAGHSSVVTVLDRYGHLQPGLQDQVTDALDRLARNARDQEGDTGIGRD